MNAMQLFIRFMAADMRRDRHRQEYHFQRHVGSSFDPELEDMAEWESHVEPRQSACPSSH